MDNQMIDDHVRSERLRGFSDDVIRSELLKSGWKEADVAAVLTPLSVNENRSVIEPSAINTPAFSLKNKSADEIGWRVTIWGFAFFLFASFVFYLYPRGLRHYSGHSYVYALFVAVNAVNSVAAFFIMSAMFRLSRSIWYKIWIGLLAAIIILFAVGSTITFLQIMFFWSRSVLGISIYTIGYVSFFILLPLQVAVFLVSLATVRVVRSRRRKGAAALGTPSAKLANSLLFFFVMALLALGDIYLAYFDTSIKFPSL